jgi:hypothetical protein
MLRSALPNFRRGKPKFISGCSRQFGMAGSVQIGDKGCRTMFGIERARFFMKPV